MEEIKKITMDRKTMTTYMKAGTWRHVPQKEKWWEVLDSEVQSRISRALKDLHGLQ